VAVSTAEVEIAANAVAGSTTEVAVVVEAESG
jgi:hypothetical protein